MEFVLDNSVAMRKMLPEDVADQEYAETVFASMDDGATASAPHLWRLEAVHASLRALRRGDITEQDWEQFIEELEEYSISIDVQTADQAFKDTFALAKTHGLTSYDAAYLELAIRRGLPLATLDRQLQRAATRAGVPLYLRD